MLTPDRQDSTPGARRVASARQGRWEPGLLQVITMVLWMSFLAVGLLGLLLSPAPPAPKPAEKKPEPPPVQAEVMNVQLEQALPDTDAPPAPPAPAEAAMPDVPDLPVVAAPSAAIAFAQPIEGPVRIGSGRFANPARIALARPHVQRLVYGRGEGRQPKPEYPFEAVSARQEGSVGVRLMVGADGSVQSALVITPSRWPLLNQAALDAVRETWRFPSGPQRVYDVVIHFHLNQT